MNFFSAALSLLLFRIKHDLAQDKISWGNREELSECEKEMKNEHNMKLLIASLASRHISVKLNVDISKFATTMSTGAVNSISWLKSLKIHLAFCFSFSAIATKPACLKRKISRIRQQSFADAVCCLLIDSLFATLKCAKLLVNTKTQNNEFSKRPSPAKFMSLTTVSQLIIYNL